MITQTPLTLTVQFESYNQDIIFELARKIDLKIYTLVDFAQYIIDNQFLIKAEKYSISTKETEQNISTKLTDALIDALNSVNKS